ncbi:MAG: hypothetical protein EKK68_10545 [Candidatus Competibacteraceae bacterium]|nr:MAG: hypothetical protein EKK68_10545 [Candidatus Competibacteraceae bacterium]
MTLGTHVAFASVLYLGGATLFGYKPDWNSGLLAAIASSLQDIDLPTSKIGRLFWFISAPLERRFGHRTLTHSLVMLSVVEGLDGLKHIGLRVFPHGIAGPLNLFNLQGEEAFHGCVVVAVPLAAHAAEEAVLGQ